MQIETDWFALWKELVSINFHSPGPELVSRFKTHTRKRSERPDSLLDYVLKTITSDMTVIDIGAGSGRWTIPLAKITRNVTAVEPSSAMADILRENIADAKLGNITIVSSSWEEAIVEPHDIIVCAHAMYASPDLASFARKMEQYAGKACYLAIRLPPADGIIGELTRAVYGRFHDSPNAIIAYNALNSIGIYVNVLVEDDINYWTNNTFEEAFDRAKRHLNLHSSTAYDELIRDTLVRRLIQSGGNYRWPDGMRSALLWWCKPGSR